MVRTLGAGLVGMSTALEAIAVRQLGGEVLGLSLVTNPAAGVVAEPIHHEDVLAVGEAAVRPARRPPGRRRPGGAGRRIAVAGPQLDLLPALLEAPASAP